MVCTRILLSDLNKSRDDLICNAEYFAKDKKKQLPLINSIRAREKKERMKMEKQKKKEQMESAKLAKKEETEKAKLEKKSRWIKLRRVGQSNLLLENNNFD